MTTALNSASVLLASTSMTTVYTAPSGGTTKGSQLFHLVAANYDGSNSADVTIVRTDGSDTILGYVTGKNTTIGAQLALVAAEYLILQPGHKIRAQASAASRISVDVSAREES